MVPSQRQPTLKIFQFSRFVEPSSLMITTVQYVFHQLEMMLMKTRKGLCLAGDCSKEKSFLIVWWLSMSLLNQTLNAEMQTGSTSILRSTSALAELRSMMPAVETPEDHLSSKRTISRESDIYNELLAASLYQVHSDRCCEQWRWLLCQEQAQSWLTRHLHQAHSIQRLDRESCSRSTV